MEATGLDMDWYCYRHRTEDEVLPWDHLSAGLHKDFLWQDWRDALEELGLEDCRWTPCYDCGACTGYGIEHVVASAVPPGGRQPGHRPGPAARRRGARHAAGSQAGGGGRVKQRVRFAKSGKVRFLSHRDVARVWERALRRSGVRVAYSEGFSPRPRLSFGLALSTGYESLGEYLDIDLAEPVDPDDAARASSTPRCPPGIVTQAAISIPAGTDSLQQAVTSSSWQLELSGVDPDRVAAAVERVLAQDELADHRRAQGQRGPARRPARHPRPGQPRTGPRGRAGHPTPQPPPRGAAPSAGSLVDRRPGTTNTPMDVGRRRPLRADPPRGSRRTRRDVGPARGSACVMRRDLPDDRTPHRRHCRRPHPRAHAPAQLA